MDADQLQQAAAKQKTVAGAHPGNETFLDRADLAAAQVLHRDARVADDRADVHAVAPCQAQVGHAPDAFVVGQRAVIVRIDRQRRATLLHKIQRPLPVRQRQLRIGGCRAHFGIQRVGQKAAAQGDGDQVLDQHIERLLGRRPGFDQPLGNGDAGGSAFDHFNALRGHQRDARGPARRMA